jgi:hypothetical protein
MAQVEGQLHSKHKALNPEVKHSAAQSEGEEGLGGHMQRKDGQTPPGLHVRLREVLIGFLHISHEFTFLFACTMVVCRARNCVRCLLEETKPRVKASLCELRDH